MNIGAKINYYLLLYFCKAIGLLPTWFLYHCLLDFVYFIVYKVVKYRVKIVKTNLRNSFPSYDNSQLLDIERKFYRHLSELFIDTIDLTGISEKEIRKRLTVSNLDEFEQEVKGKNWIGGLAHYGSWEYFSAYQLYTQTQMIGVYKPIHNRVFDKFYIETRSKFGATPVAKNDLFRFVINKSKTPGNFSLGMISDQSPSDYKNSVRLIFLNQETAFFTGMSKFALKLNMPIYFIHMKKTKRAHYVLTPELIYDGVEQIDNNEIITRYARKLEEMIIERPELWMWSHRRWKNYKLK